MDLEGSRYWRQTYVAFPRKWTLGMACAGAALAAPGETFLLPEDHCLVGTWVTCWERGDFHLLDFPGSKLCLRQPWPRFRVALNLSFNRGGKWGGLLDGVPETPHYPH